MFGFDVSLAHVLWLVAIHPQCMATEEELEKIGEHLKLVPEQDAAELSAAHVQLKADYQALNERMRAGKFGDCPKEMTDSLDVLAGRAKALMETVSSALSALPVPVPQADSSHKSGL